MATKSKETAWVLALFLLGCGDAPTPPVTLAADSAGVRMVRNRGPDLPLQVTEVLRIGVAQGDPDLEFHEIRDLAVDAHGGVWVSDSYESVRHYGPKGAFLGSVGGRGEGPGEASRGYADVLTGQGTVLAMTYDATLQLFSQKGDFLGQRSLLEGPGRYLIPLGEGPDAWTVFFRGVPHSEETLVRGIWTVGRAPPTKAGFDSLLVLPGKPLAGSGAERFHGSFFLGSPAIAGDGRGNVYYTDSLEYRIEVYDHQGTMVKVVTRDIPGTPVPTDIRHEVEEGAREGLRELLMAGNPPREEDVQRTVERVLPGPLPTHLPFLEGVLVSAQGHIWAQRGDCHPSPALRGVAEAFGFIRAVWPESWRAPIPFDLFSAEGEYRGSVVLSELFTPMAATEDRIYGSIRDELDLQYVVAFSVSGADRNP